MLRSNLGEWPQMMYMDESTSKDAVRRFEVEATYGTFAAVMLDTGSTGKRVSFVHIG